MVTWVELQCVIVVLFAHWIKYLRFYPWIENPILPMLFNPGVHVGAVHGCIGTHAHGHQVTSLLY